MNKNLTIYLRIVTELRALDYSAKKISELSGVDIQRSRHLSNDESKFYKKEITDRELSFFIKNIKMMDKKLLAIVNRAEKILQRVK